MSRDFKVKIETEEEFFTDLIAQAERIDQGIIPEKTVERVSFADHPARNDEFDSLIAEARRQGEEVGLKQSDITAAIAKVRADKIAFPEWRREVLTVREADLRDGKESFSDWETAKDQLK
ncbi:MAG: hypothetical protein Q7U44_04030 [Desulfuromonadales bacterium]|nr:hypothetical protein [Desulfuromonadales bacterium]